MAEIIKNLSEDTLELPQTSAPSVTTDKLYNVGGALTFNGTDISSGGGGIAAVVDDTTPQLGGSLDVNGFSIIGQPAVTDGAGGDLDLLGGAAASTQALLPTQQQDRYTGVGDFGTFSGTATGTFYVAADVITMSDGSTVTVGSVDGGGNILTFQVTTSGGTTVTTGVTLTQTSVAPANGQTGFTLTPEIGNVTGSAGGHIYLIAGQGAGSGADGQVKLAAVLNTNDFDITGPVKDSGTFHHVNIVAGIANNDTTASNDVNITGGEMDYLAGGGTVAAGNVNIYGGGLVNRNDDATGGSVNIVGASLPLQTDGTDTAATAGGVNITGGDAPDALVANGGIINLTAGDAYATSGSSFGGNIVIKAGEAYDFPGNIILEGGGEEGGVGGAVILQASVYGGALGNYGGDERTTALRFQGLQSNTTLSPSGRILDNYIALKAPDNIGASPFTLTLPVSDSTGTQALVSNGSGILSWSSLGGGAATDLATSGADVNVDAAAPPSIGQTLIATGATTATWQTPTAGGVANPMTVDLDTGGYAIKGLTALQGIAVDIEGGESTGYNYGGNVRLTAGDGGQSGGSVILKGGETSAAYAGGTVTMYGGDATGSAGIGGAINLLAGDGGNSGNGGGGNIRIAPGNGGGSTGAGAIVINHNINQPVTTGDKLYNAVIRSTAERTLHWDGLDLTSALRGLDALNNTPSFNFGTDINLNGGDGYLGAGPTAGIGGDIVLTAGLSRAPSSGTQEVNIGGAGDFPTGSFPSGLANDATVYTAAIVVDGGSSQPIAITGSTAQTHATLIDELNADTTGATWSITAGSDLIATSDSTGIASTIAITDTDLFVAVNNFVSVDAANAGIAPTTGAIVIPDQTAPSPTTNKLYAVAGALTWNGTDLTAGGGGISNVVEDTTPQLGGDLDVNGYSIVSPAGSGVGAGGILAVTAGIGGSTGPGGTVTITAGAGGSISGDGGVSLLSGGDAGTAGSGGSVNIVGGDSSTTAGEAGGDINITSGTSFGNSGFGNHAGDINLTGADYATNGGYGGAIDLTAGKSLGKNSGSPVDITGGYGYDCNNGGDVSITGGATYYDGGDGFAGGVLITGGFGKYGTSGNAYGGDVRIAGGDTSGNWGGSLYLSGGEGPGQGGSITLQPGLNNAGSAPGSVNLAAAEFGIGFGPFAATQLRFFEPNSGNNYVSLESPASIGSNVSWLLPSTDSTGTQALVSDGSGNLSWSALGGGGGGLTVAVVAATSATTAAAQATMVDDDTAGSTVTITLLAGSANDQQVIKKLGTTANVIVDGDSAETIDGAATFTLTSQYASVTLIWNGTEWSII